MFDYKGLKDEELLVLLKSETKRVAHAAYGELYLRYFILIRRFVLKTYLDQDVASDVAQDILVSLWHKRLDVDVKFGLRNYLFRAALNHVSNYTRKDKVAAAYEDDFRARYEEAFASTDDIVAVKEINETLMRALEQMNPKMRLVFESSRFENLTSTEISKEYDIPRDTVKDQIKRALHILRKMGLKLNSLF